MPKILSLIFILSALANIAFLQVFKEFREDKQEKIHENQRLQENINDLTHQNETLRKKFMEQLNTFQKNNDELENQIKKLRNENGRLKKELISRNAIRKPIAKKSIKIMNGSGEKSGRKLLVSASAYTSHDAGMSGKGMTAMGTKARDGRTIAVDPKVIKLGSKVYIEGLGHRIAEDTGRSIKGNKIDIYFNSKSKALKWGKRNVKITVVN